MRLIDADELMKYPIRLNTYDKKNGDVHFIDGIESVLEYAESLPTVEAIPMEWIDRYIEKMEKEVEEESDFIVTYCAGYGTNYSLMYSLGVRGMIMDWKKEESKDE